MDYDDLERRLRRVADFGGTHLDGLWTEAADALLAAMDEIEALKAKVEMLKAEIASMLSTPAIPGGFVGDIFFGHPNNRTLGTHRWDGQQWLVIEPVADTLVHMLAKARCERDAAEARGYKRGLEDAAKVRFGIPSGKTRDEMRDWLANTEDGRALYAQGDCLLVWANEGDLIAAAIRAKEGK